MEKQECSICHNSYKGLKSHIRMAHPEADVDKEEVGIKEEEVVNKVEPIPEANLEEAIKVAEPLIVAGVNKVLTEMNLPGAIDKAVGDRVMLTEQRLSKQIGDVAAAIRQRQGGDVTQSGEDEEPQPDDPTRPPAQQGENNKQLQDTILAALAQKFIGGGNDNSSGFGAFLKQMTDFQNASAILYHGPRLQAQKEVVDIIKAGLGMEMTPQQIITGVEKNLEGLAKPAA